VIFAGHGRGDAGPRDRPARRRRLQQCRRADPLRRARRSRASPPSPTA
jgi:hypothetical protein